MTVDEELQDWLKEAVARNAPKMQESSMFASIVTDGFFKDPTCMLQIGMAVLMDKPIVIIADKDTKIPASLMKIARLVERVDLKSDADMSRVSVSISAFAKALHQEGL